MIFLLYYCESNLNEMEWNEIGLNKMKLVKIFEIGYIKEEFWLCKNIERYF